MFTKIALDELSIMISQPTIEMFLSVIFNYIISSIQEHIQIMR